MAEDTARSPSGSAQARSDAPGARPLGGRAAAGRDRARAVDALAAIVMDEPTSASCEPKSRSCSASCATSRPKGCIIFVTQGSKRFAPLRPLHGSRDGHYVARRVADSDCRRHHPHDGRAQVGALYGERTMPTWAVALRSRASTVAATARSARHRARRRFVRAMRAKSSAWPGWSAPAAPRRRARCSAPTVRPGVVRIDGEPVDIRKPARRHRHGVARP